MSGFKTRPRGVADDDPVNIPGPREKRHYRRGDAWDSAELLMDAAEGVRGFGAANPPDTCPRLRTPRRLRPEWERMWDCSDSQEVSLEAAIL